MRIWDGETRYYLGSVGIDRQFNYDNMTTEHKTVYFQCWCKIYYLLLSLISRNFPAIKMCSIPLTLSQPYYSTS